MGQQDETSLFQQCRTLDGQIQPIQLGRRNGRPMPIFPPDYASPRIVSEESVHDLRIDAIRKELSINLNPIERKTWDQLIHERSIGEIARNEGKTRSAIYERIRGNSKGQGGMVAKNPYVAWWWCQRQLAGDRR